MPRRRRADDNTPAATEAQAQAPPKRPRRKAAGAAAAPAPVAPAELRGRLASEVQQASIEWLLKPWVPRGILSMVVGCPGVGKSTCLAWLLSGSYRSCILPGYEESVESMLLPRLHINRVDLSRLRILDDAPYRFPSSAQRIASIMCGWDARLLVIDPVDSYLDDTLNENVGRDVRIALESIAWVASETGAAVVCARHPGKDRTNIMPGSRQWGAVAKVIMELSCDGETPPRRMMRHWRDSTGQDTTPVEYRLDGHTGCPKRWVLCDPVDATLSDLAAAAGDPASRRKVLEAARLIRHLFSLGGPPAVQDLVQACRELGIGEHARDEARRLLGVDSRPAEVGGRWVMSRSDADWPPWLD